ncbi:MAG: rRNA pseudouridine synthase [Synergistaceae bacterium]|nr:rRNA pseudouridine synthase [Synergistaceae bacterium]MBR1658216.1 rRNA pseudouridine synthase [Synergistaceae bacterium]
MRLNKFISSCGIAARRKAETLILSGRIQVNGKIVLAPFYEVDPRNDIVTFDHKELQLIEKVYYVMNKPAGYVCASADKFDPVVVSLITDYEGKLYPIGRLDKDTEGLLIITNDGTFTHNVLHPSKRIPKEYEALLNIPINERQAENWRKGVDTPDGRFVTPVRLEIMDREPANRWVRVVIISGHKHEVKLMANGAGFSVERLIRRKIGKMTLETLKTGEYARLSISELSTKIFNGGIV